MREKFISVWGFETVLAKRGVHNLLHYEREKLHSVFPSGNRETKRGWGAERGRCLLYAGEERDSHILLKSPEPQRWREVFIKSKWSRINKGIEIRKIMTAKNATAQRNVGSRAHNMNSLNTNHRLFYYCCCCCCCCKDPARTAL
jgi:hypothetical protein